MGVELPVDEQGLLLVQGEPVELGVVEDGMARGDGGVKLDGGIVEVVVAFEVPVGGGCPAGFDVLAFVGHGGTTDQERPELVAVVGGRCRGWRRGDGGGHMMLSIGCITCFFQPLFPLIPFTHEHTHTLSLSLSLFSAAAARDGE